GGADLLNNVDERIREIVGNNGIYGRYGADRFIFLQESKSEREFRKIFFAHSEGTFAQKEGNLSVKWGIYEITDRSIPVEQMCDRALLAADSIKGQYNKPFAVYDDALRGKLLREKAITDAMEIALAEEQFVVYLQPKFSIKEECMIGAEALVRWIHPQWGFMSPGEFIPLFEKNGFISRLDQFVWEKVCQTIANWQQKGIAPLPVSVNVSRADMFNAQLASTLLGTTQKYGVAPELLHLEITESAYADNPKTLVSTVNQLREAGFVIEMDDFGSGYSSLNMLSQMRLDVLKLDMKFIQNEMEKPAYQSILKDIVNMAHRMHLRVVAEGVETREQMKRLQAVGCDLVQGYFFAKPMPVADFEKTLKEQREKTQNVAPQQQQPLGLRTLLIVDDDEKFRQNVRKAFEGQYCVAEAANAKSALEFVAQHGRDGISAVILSVSLPCDEASEVLNFLNQDPSLWKIPVLATMAAGERQQCLPVARAADDFLCKLHPIFDLHKRVQHLVDAAESHQRERVLLDEACRDYITGLLNRRGLQASVNALRTEDLPLAICLFDLDNLKLVNDTSGHEVGDKIIQTFADLLRRQTRAEDIQCRYGGDEFVVILKRINNPETAVRIGANICNSFQKTLEEEQIAASCSCGVAMSKEIDMPFGKLLEQADQALYAAKRENKGGCRLFEK
ncbi:MAG: EAL domain-containing protein, partial [Candidatus Fimimonas sp.]